MELELLKEYETRLLEKEHSGCAALLRDDRVPPPPPQPPALERVWSSARLSKLGEGIEEHDCWQQAMQPHCVAACILRL